MTEPTPYYQDPDVTLYCGSADDLGSVLPDGAAQLLIADPPYFKVVDAAFDHQWECFDEYLTWLDGHVRRWEQALAANGSVYVFCWPPYAGRVEAVVARHCEVLNHIVWEKAASRAEGTEKEALRCFFPASERIVFAEKIGSDGSALRGSGYAAADASSRAGVFEPLRAYLVAERDAAGVSNREVDAHLGTNGMAGHYFGASQWALPSEEVYEKLRSLFNGRGGENEFLRRDYEDLRRPFNASKRTPYTDVWHHAPMQWIPGKHPAEKPLALISDIIEVSSRPGDLVVDPMAGSGSSLVAAKRLGRRAVGFEKEERWCALAASRLSQGFLDLGAAAWP